MSMRSRRGSLDWNLETVGKLIIGIAVLIVVIYISMKLIGLFITNDIAADRALGLLSDRIALARSGDIKGQELSVIVALPPGYFIAGFNPGSEGIGSADADVPISRPKECGSDGCLCAFSFDSFSFKTVEPISCARFDTVRIVSSTGKILLFSKNSAGTHTAEFSVPPYAGGSYPVILGGPPASVRIGIVNDVVVLDPRQSAPVTPSGGGGGGGY